MVKTTLFLLAFFLLGLTAYFLFLHDGPGEDLPGKDQGNVVAGEEKGDPAALAGETVGPGAAKTPGPERRVMEGTTAAAKARPGGELTGLVQDQEGLPLSGVEIECKVISGAGNGPWKTDTGTDGTWQLSPNFEEEKVHLRVRASCPGRVTDSHLIWLSKGAKKQVAPLVLPPGAVVLGRVADERGTPVVGATVSVGMLGFGSGRSSAQTDQEGAYRIAGVKPGEQRLTVDAKGFALAYRKASLTAGQVPNRVDFTLRQGLFISGRVIDHLGNPVVGAQVSLVRHSRSEGFVMITSSDAERVKTDADGRFHLGNLEEASFRLKVEAKGYLEGTLPEVKAGTQGLQIRLGQGGGISGRLLLPDGQPARGFTVKMMRQVTPPEDAPDPRPFLLSRSREKWEFKDRAAGDFAIEGLLPGEHTFLFTAPSCPPLQHKVRVRSNQVLDLGTLRLPSALALQVLVLDDQGRPLAGAQVEARPAGTAGEGERVLVQAGGGGGSRAGSLGNLFISKGKDNLFATDKSGRVRLTGLAPGTYDLTVSHDDYAPLDVLSLTAAREPEEVKVVLDRGGSIAIHLQGREGSSPAEQSVLVAPAEPGPPGGRRRVRTDAGGQVQVDRLAPGAYTVKLSRQLQVEMGGMSITVPLLGQKGHPAQVRRGQVTRVDLQLPGKWHLSGLVEDGQGPVAGAQVVLTVKGMPLGKWQTKTGADGSFEFRDIQPAEYLLTWGRPGCPVRSRLEMELDDQGGRWARTLAIPAGSIQGRVCKEGREPAQGLVIKLDRVRKPGARVVRSSVVTTMLGRGRRMPGLGGKKDEIPPILTDEQGNYLVREVPPGDWLLTVKQPGTGRTLASRKVKVGEGGGTRVSTIHLPR